MVGPRLATMSTAREVVIDGVTGFLLPRASVAPLSDAVVNLAADPRAAPIGAEGRRRFADRFRHERMADDLHALYERILQRGPKADCIQRVS